MLALSGTTAVARPPVYPYKCGKPCVNIPEPPHENAYGCCTEEEVCTCKCCAGGPPLPSCRGCDCAGAVAVRHKWDAAGPWASRDWTHIEDYTIPLAAPFEELCPSRCHVGFLNGYPSSAYNQYCLCGCSGTWAGTPWGSWGCGDSHCNNDDHSYDAPCCPGCVDDADTVCGTKNGIIYWCDIQLIDRLGIPEAVRDAHPEVQPGHGCEWAWEVNVGIVSHYYFSYDGIRGATRFWLPTPSRLLCPTGLSTFPEDGQTVVRVGSDLDPGTPDTIPANGTWGSCPFLEQPWDFFNCSVT